MDEHADLRRTAFYDEHVRAGGKMVPFAGHWMPVQFEGIAAEHQRVRNCVGLFDVSHMGEIVFQGPKAETVLQRIVTNDVIKAGPGKAIYTPVCYPDGGIVDDMIVYKRSPTDLFICVNASNKDKDFQWFVEQAAGECEVADLSDRYSQIAIQGPAAPDLLVRVLGAEAGGMKPFTFKTISYRGAEVIVSTTGYTGERGGEVYVPHEAAVSLWRDLIVHGEEMGVAPIGLGARDTLRLEKNYCLYGNDIDQTTTPIEAGIEWTVKLGKGDFVGREVLARQVSEGVRRKLVGFVAEGKGIPRHGYPILFGDEEVGHVTSGTLSPSLKVPVGLGYVNLPHHEVGTRLEVDLKGLRKVAVRVVEPPLFKHPH